MHVYVHSGGPVIRIMSSPCRQSPSIRMSVSGMEINCNVMRHILEQYKERQIAIPRLREKSKQVHAERVSMIRN